MKKNNGIWIMLDSSKPGGIESHVLQLAEGLHHHGENISVVFLKRYGDHPLRNSLQQRGITTLDLDGRFTTLLKVMRRQRPSILHTHGYKAGLFGRLAAKLCRLPVVTTYHAGEIPSGMLALYDWLDRQSARLACKVFAVSPQIAQRLPVPAKVVDNFVDTTGLTVSNGNQIAFVGRLSREKGADYFVELAGRFPDKKFHIYGDGPQMDELKIAASSNLHFHGQQDDMTPIWSDIGLLIMPSRHEGLPMAALEAMARGIPVLASHVGALDQLIDTGSNGWLVTTGNGDALAERLQLWINMNKPQKQQLKQAARQKILQRFSAEIAIPQLISSYQQLIT